MGPHRAFAVVLGFGGVLLMVEPHSGFGAGTGSSIGAAAALSGALLSAFVVIFIRHMSATEKSEAIVFYFMVVCAAAGAVTMLWSFQALTWTQAGLLVLCGVMGGVGQLCMTYSYRYAEPSLLAAFDYTAMIWAVALGYLFFAEVPERIVLAGAGVVIASGLYIVWRERRAYRANLPLVGRSENPKDFPGGGAVQTDGSPPTRNAPLRYAFRPPHEGEVDSASSSSISPPPK